MPEDKPIPVTYQTIGQLERGGIGYAIDTAIREVLNDCTARPALTAKRTLTITVSFTPEANSLDQGRPGLNGVGLQAQVKVALPARKGGTETLAVVTGVGVNGQPETQAVFIQPPLFPGSN